MILFIVQTLVCVHTILEHYKEFITDEELVALGNELSVTERMWQSDTSENLENSLSSVPPFTPLFPAFFSAVYME